MTKRYSVTVTLTPWQAVALDEAIRHGLLTLPWGGRWMSLLSGAKSRVQIGLRDDGWERDAKGWTK